MIVRLHDKPSEPNTLWIGYCGDIIAEFCLPMRKPNYRGLTERHGRDRRRVLTRPAHT